ncbi:MAG: TRAP transporter large permease subunit, partial [Bacteroidetes bacterium]|nr:TRAP transporter large permease subunit [Bacteroidota bacterium]
GIVNSYGQIFFSNHKWFGYLLLLASFIDPYIGISGFIAAASSVIFADWMGYNKGAIRSALYSYNSILVGFTIGVFFQFNLAFFGILLLGSLFTMLISVWLAAFFSSYRIPFLSLPFMLGVWAVLLGAKGFQAIELSERGIFAINEVYSFWGKELGDVILQITAFKLPLLIDVYLKSLGAIFFQYNLLVGIIIALGLLIYSRIAFTLSVLGFLTGYYFVELFQGNMSELEYSYIGFNYILSSLGIPQMLAKFMTGLPLPGWAIMLVIIGFYLALGTFMEGISMVITTIPLLFPVFKDLGYDPIWFGVVITMLVEIAMISPPDGTVLYVLQGMRRQPGPIT